MESPILENGTTAVKTTGFSSAQAADVIPVIGAVICQELGIETDDIEADTDLRQEGLTSLTALMITVKLLEEHGIDLGPGTLKENYSLCLLQKALSRKERSVTSPKVQHVRFDLPSPVAKLAPVATQVMPTISVEDSEGVIPKVMDIIAQEMELDEIEFSDTAEWANLGLDSIMSLAICGRLREELEIEVENTVFAEYESVGAFKEHLSQGHLTS
jgi:acyl carrier protein